MTPFGCQARLANRQPPLRQLLHHVEGEVAVDRVGALKIPQHEVGRQHDDVFDADRSTIKQLCVVEAERDELIQVKRVVLPTRPQASRRRQVESPHRMIQQLCPLESHIDVLFLGGIGVIIT